CRCWIERAEHHNRHEHIRRNTNTGAREALSGNADHLKARAIEKHVAADDAAVLPEDSLPKRVAEDRIRVSAYRFVVTGIEQPAERGTHTEHVEIIPADHTELDELRAGPTGQAEADWAAAT